MWRISFIIGRRSRELREDSESGRMRREWSFEKTKGKWKKKKRRRGSFLGRIRSARTEESGDMTKATVRLTQFFFISDSWENAVRNIYRCFSFLLLRFVFRSSINRGDRECRRRFAMALPDSRKTMRLQTRRRLEDFNVNSKETLGKQTANMVGLRI